MESVAVQKSLYDKHGKPVEKGITGFTFNSASGGWTGSGANGEVIELIFYRATDTTNPILYNITDPANYGSQASPGPLVDLANSTHTGLDETKVKMRINISVNRTFPGTCGTVVANLTTGIINFSTGPAASYTMTGTGHGVLSNGQKITMDTMVVTASNNGATIAGASTTNVPLSDGTYVIVCEFNQNGCVKNTLTKNGVEVGIVTVEGSNVVVTDKATGAKKTINK